MDVKVPALPLFSFFPPHPLLDRGPLDLNGPSYRTLNCEVQLDCVAPVFCAAWNDNLGAGLVLPVPSAPHLEQHLGRYCSQLT